MLLTLTTTHWPATDLGYLLRKNPARPQVFDLGFGRAHIFYPEAGEERCTAALLVEVDPVGLVRNRRGPAGEGGLLQQYVNDRPYVASSFLSVAISQVLGSALAGGCKEKPELAEQPLPLRAVLSAVPCRGGEEFLRRLFEPLGYRVQATRAPLDEQFPAWGESAYHRVELEATLPVHQLLSHLYVLVPVLDNDKHYWVGDDEVDKLLRHGEGWLGSHPERDIITRRYLKHQRGLVDDALARLVDENDPDPDTAAEANAQEEAVVEKALSLNEQRLGTVLAVLKASGAARVLDLGCGEGRLLQALLKEKQFREITGMEVSHSALEIATDRLRYDRLPALQKERLRLLHGSLIYRDARLAGFDAAAVVEVIEHLDPPRLAAFERVLFECARPGTIVITTPNSEYNVKWETLPAGKFRHRDHRFEWTRAEFQAWSTGVAARFGYQARFLPVGPEDNAVGAPTQMGVFEIQVPGARCMNEELLSPADERSNAELIALALANAKDIDESDEEYWHPVRLLQHRLDMGLLQEIRGLAESQEPLVRILVADILGQSRHEEKNLSDEVFALLSEMLAMENDTKVIASITFALGWLKDDRSIQHLIRLASHPDKDVRYATTHGLGGVERLDAVEALIKLSADSDYDVRNWATFNLGSLIEHDSVELRDALWLRLTEEEAEARGEAIVGLIRRGDLRVLEPLQAALAKSDGETEYAGALRRDMVYGLFETIKRAPAPEWLPVLNQLHGSYLCEAAELAVAIESCSGITSPRLDATPII